MDPVSGLGRSSRAIAQALEHEPSLRGARTDIDVARGMRVQAGLRPNPTVSFYAAGGTMAARIRQTRIEVAWPLDLFRQAGRVGVAEREIEAARHAVADRERLLAADVRTEVRQTWPRPFASSRCSTTCSPRRRAQHALVAARVEQGATPPLERDMLRVELQRLESDRLLQSGAVERALIELKRTLGMAADVPLKIRDDLEQLVQREAPGAAARRTARRNRRGRTCEAAEPASRSPMRRSNGPRARAVST